MALGAQSCPTLYRTRQPRHEPPRSGHSDEWIALVTPKTMERRRVDPGPGGRCFPISGYLAARLDELPANDSNW